MPAYRPISSLFPRALVTLILGLAFTPFTMAYQSAFPPTESGVTELKTLPAGVLLKSSASGSYFERGSSLFRPLFRYISDHNISMTVPVEASIDGAAMYFWVAESEQSKVSGDRDGVEVIEIPERLVVSRGEQGAYAEENFEKTRDQALAWIKTQDDLEIAGAPYAVFWNGPFTLWFLKRFEVHVPVRKVTAEPLPETG
jgi:hypothetical protein